MTPGLTSTERYRPAATLGRVLVVMLALNVLASLLGIASDILQADLARDGVAFGETTDVDAPVDLREIGILLFAVFELFVFIPTVVIFCVWMYRAHKNLVALGNARQHLEHSSGWAVGSFFVPFVNLVVPYTAMREIWAKSDPEVTEETPFLRFAGGAPGVMKLWWGFWIASNVVNNIALRLSWRSEGADAALGVAWLDLFANVLEIPAALLAIRVVRGVVERQERRAPLVAHIANVPPPPPIFSPQTVPSPYDQQRPPQDPPSTA
jgi:hypothetical protein